jgi:uncharacterized protein (DUF488 family)
MASPRLKTIGVYGFSGEEFIAALQAAGVGAVLDVRQRRGVRGREYMWANAKRLEAALDDARIGYRHLSELAPTTAMRELQYAEDDKEGVGKRNRVHLAESYTRAYTQEILDPQGIGLVLDAMGKRTASALLCVERDAEACHRSLIAARYTEVTGEPVEHLRPAD